MNIIQALKSDEEYMKMRKEWIEKGMRPFPGYNYNEYNGIEDYKSKIRKELEASNKS